MDKSADHLKGGACKRWTDPSRGRESNGICTEHINQLGVRKDNSQSGCVGRVVQTVRYPGRKHQDKVKE